MSLQQLVSDFGTYQKQTEELAKDLRKNFFPLFEPLFKKHPWVESLSWRQCEPWNDGEETEFKVMADAERITINDLNWYDDEVYDDEAKKDVFKEFAAALEEVPTEIMMAMFGESNEVEVSKDGVINVTVYED